MIKIFIAFIILFKCSPGNAQDTAVNFFEGTLDQAAAKAVAEGKQIFIDVYTDWCAPCKAVEKYVFSTEVAARYFNEHFINLKVDAEKNNGPAFAESFKVKEFPTFIVLNADKSAVARWIGASLRPTAATFIEKVKAEIMKN